MAISKVLPNNQFARDVGVLMGGTAGAQVMMVLAAPLLTRLYSPNDFGVLAVYAGLLGLFTAVTSLRYEFAIPLPKDNLVAANLVALCLLVVVGVTAVAGLLVWLAGDSITRALGVPKLAPYFWLLPVGVFSAGTYQVFNYWAIRNKQYPIIARARICQAFTTIGIQLVSFKAGVVALLLGQAGGQGMGGIILARTALSRLEFQQWSWQGVSRAASCYRNFPIYSTWSGLFNAAGQQLPQLMFAALFSVGAAGFYALAYRVLAMPMSVIGQAVGNVFFANAAEAYREGQLGPLVSKVHDKLAQIAMPPTLILMFTGPELFTLLFGDQWRQAGEFARWMAPWLYMVFVTSPLSTLFSVMEKQRQGMLFQAILLVARITAIAAGASYADLMTTVLLFSFVSALCWLGFLVWIALSTANTVAMILRPMRRALAISLVCVSPLWLGTQWPLTSVVWWLALFVSAILVGWHYLRLKRKSSND